MKNFLRSSLIFAICIATVRAWAGDVATPPSAAAAQTPAPLEVAPPPQPAAPVTPPAIPFNAQNKAVATRVYQLMKEIQDSEFDPEANMGFITKLQDAVAQTDFSGVPQMADYVKDSLTLNTLRSHDIKIQRTDAGKSDKENGSKAGVHAGGGFLNLSGGVENENTKTQKHESDTSTDVSITAQNDPAVLDKARHQQATSYGFLLNELKKLGFARPVDPNAVYGRWSWRCGEDSATYEFDFRKDGTVYVRLKADHPERWVGHGFVNKGRGTWKLDYRSLSLEMNDVNLAGFWKQHSLIFFEGKEIVGIDDEKMLIASDEDNELKRIAGQAK